MKLQKNQAIQAGELQHSNHRYQDLADTYGTPLYIFDEESFLERARGYRNALKNDHFETEVLYASKALLTKEIARLISQEDIGQDVVSAGEIYAGVQGGISPSKMYFHGNNKTDQELEFAIENKVGTIVLDNRNEAERLNKVLEKHQKKQRVLLRINPGVEAHTHEYIVTATNDSKFGESVFDSAISDVIGNIYQLDNLELVGFHSHIGSQIFDETSFLKAVDELVKFASQVQETHQVQISELNFGGGFGVYYTQEDQPFDVIDFLPKFVDHVQQVSESLNVPLKKVTIEPGRSLVNDSGSTLYTVGDLKETVSGRNYLFIDGGMTDNIRHALYQAEYEALIVNKAEENPSKTYTVAGKACESGDKIIEAVDLPEAETNDLLLVNGTGAYNFTMASNYNYIPRPAMVHINQEQVKLTVKRDTLEDLLRNQI